MKPVCRLAIAFALVACIGLAGCGSNDSGGMQAATDVLSTIGSDPATEASFGQSFGTPSILTWYGNKMGNTRDILPARTHSPRLACARMRVAGVDSGSVLDADLRAEVRS